MSADPVREGYAKVKSKHLGTWNKRWLKLRPANARQPNRLEKYQDEACATAGGERATYDLTEVRYVDRMKANDKKSAVCIVLNNYEVVQFAFSSDMEANNWLHDAQKMVFGKTEASSMFEVYMMKAPALNNASGECLLQVTEDSVRLLDIDNPRRVQLELPLATIRRYSTERGMLRLVTGRSSPIGEGELMFDTHETDAIYNSIQRATKEMVNRSQNKSTPTPAAAVAATVDEGLIDYRMSNHEQPQQSFSAAPAAASSTRRGASSKSGRTVHEKPPEYEDSPPPYCAPEPPSITKGKGSTKTNKSSQEYMDPYEISERMTKSNQRTNSDSTYSKTTTASSSSSSSYKWSVSGRSDQVEEEAPIYIGNDDDLYTADDHVYDGERRHQTASSSSSSSRRPPSGSRSSKSAKGSETPYDLEADYHIGQGTAAASRESTASSKYSVPTKTSRTLQQQQQVDESDSTYYDVQPSRFNRPESKEDQKRSTGSISEDPTSTDPPDVPPRRRGHDAALQRNLKATTQQSKDYEEHKLECQLHKMVSEDLNLRTSLKVDHYELE